MGPAHSRTRRQNTSARHWATDPGSVPRQLPDASPPPTPPVPLPPSAAGPAWSSSKSSTNTQAGTESARPATRARGPRIREGRQDNTLGTNEIRDDPSDSTASKTQPARLP